MTACEPTGVSLASIADDVRRGLSARPKTLPPRLFYDAEGSRLYEQITALPEYYLTRAERRVLVAHSRDIVARVTRGDDHSPSVVELGAGSAAKTAIVLRALVERDGGSDRAAYYPIDVSGTALAVARRRLTRGVPGVAVHPLATTYEDGLLQVSRLPGATAPRATHLVLFLGSSVGNMTDAEASALFRRVRRALPGETWLLLGTDLRKDPARLHAAYDDAAGVTAAFNANVLARINRELGGRFDLRRFRHVARWNEDASRIEMHLESTVAQSVAIDDLHMRSSFEAGETIHTESSTKYDVARVERLLTAGGFTLESSYVDEVDQFAVHLASGINGTLTDGR